MRNRQRRESTTQRLRCAGGKCFLSSSQPVFLEGSALPSRALGKFLQIESEEARADAR